MKRVATVNLKEASEAAQPRDNHSMPSAATTPLWPCCVCGAALKITPRYCASVQVQPTHTIVCQHAHYIIRPCTRDCNDFHHNKGGFFLPLAQIQQKNSIELHSLWRIWDGFSVVSFTFSRRESVMVSHHHGVACHNSSIPSECAWNRRWIDDSFHFFDDSQTVPYRHGKLVQKLATSTWASFLDPWRNWSQSNNHRSPGRDQQSN